LILALDFDGVICDSRAECMEVAFTAYGTQVAAPADLHDEVTPIPPESAARFMRHRHLVGLPRGYWALCDLAMHDAPSECYEHDPFDAHLASHSGDVQEFEKRFFEVREALKQRDPQEWLSLHRPYEEFLDALEELRRSSVFIVTTKDSPSVRALLEQWELDVPGERIYGRERRMAKEDCMRAILGSAGAAPGELAFLDDHVPYLEACVALGVRCYFARWGFTPADVALPAGVKAVGNVREVLESGSGSVD
jgi:phosphoglycolate phosphatase-like HAD superfamily hydrolase